LQLREIKKEIRVIGLSGIKINCSYHLFGVIYRGARWLDGVLYSSTFHSEITKPIIELIVSSKHYKQIRLIMIHKKFLPHNIEINVNGLSEKLLKPVIEISNYDDEQSFEYEKGIFIKSFSIDKEKTLQVLQMTALKDYFPEALRVSGLLAQKFRAT
jgi:endonuclease V-like protein UPF0215 family